LRTKPTLSYCGLTIVFSNPSRFDERHLLTAKSGHYFQYECLHPNGFTTANCDVRTADTLEEGLLGETKGILLLGDRAFQQWTDNKYKEYTLSEQRGTPLHTRWKIPCVCSYSPQDCLDIQDYEKRLNPLAIYDKEDHNENEEETEFETKTKGRTKRSNYKFWLKFDTKKIIDKITERRPLFVVQGSRRFECRIAPSSGEVTDYLKKLKDDFLYLDIETSICGGYNLWCIGICDSNSLVYVVPIFRYNHTLYYSATPNILTTLASAMQRCVTVTHNGFAFDLLIFPWRYGIPIGHNQEDTMINHHRAFPGTEKSLGHCMSLWTDEEYHKDQGLFAPMNDAMDRRLYNYNARDVYGMRLVHQAQLEYAKKIPGLQESYRQGNDCIYPYVLCSLSGINYDDNHRTNICRENDRLMMQYLRMARILKGGFKDELLPSSSVSCVRFFHDYLGYDVVSRSRRISKKTGLRLNTPSLDEKAFWKLKLKYPENILIDLCLRYRAVQKETSMLRFEPWDIKGLPQ
jgi:hypothetical protein